MRGWLAIQSLSYQGPVGNIGIGSIKVENMKDHKLACCNKFAAHTLCTDAPSGLRQLSLGQTLTSDLVCHLEVLQVTLVGPAACGVNCQTDPLSN